MELQQREKNNPKADKSRAMKTGHLYVLRTVKTYGTRIAGQEGWLFRLKEFCRS